MPPAFGADGSRRNADAFGERFDEIWNRTKRLSCLRIDPSLNRVEAEKDRTQRSGRGEHRGRRWRPLRGQMCRREQDRNTRRDDRSSSSHRADPNPEKVKTR